VYGVAFSMLNNEISIDRRRHTRPLDADRPGLFWISAIANAVPVSWDSAYKSLVGEERTAGRPATVRRADLHNAGERNSKTTVGTAVQIGEIFSRAVTRTIAAFLLAAEWIGDRSATCSSVFLSVPPEA